MDEDIKILEEQLNIYKRHLENYEKDNCLTSVYYELKKYAQSLENLLSKLKKLEEDNIKWRANYIKALGEIDCIPKSKIRDKIEEFKRLSAEIQGYEYNCIPKDLKRNDYAVKMLEELLD